ncbi:GET complex subunit GET2 protein [Rutstroemia sp. NJR-2017a BVV2]|nr:GET complex subunit GET2 protein [Rutstroemia sp. NJR-2017a BVV2]
MSLFAARSTSINKNPPQVKHTFTKTFHSDLPTQRSTTTMADTPEAAGTETSAQRQARIRKEKREAKIKSGGSARLNKIIGLGGGLQRDEPPAPPAPTIGDPEEVDISNHYYEPQSRKPLLRNNESSPSQSQAQQQQQQLNDDQLRQMMLGMNTGPAGPGQAPFGPAVGGGFPGMDQDASGGDPMMQLLQQMMGGGAGGPGEGNAMPSFPGMNMQAQTQAAAANPYAYLWRIVHAIFALSLGLYIAFTTPFSGTKYERDAGVLEGLSTVQFFYVFASVEVLLLSSRYFLEMGKETGGGEGWVGMLMGVLPEPWKGYLALGKRYLGIWGTVSGDALVCVWVLGCCAWLRGEE